MSRLSSSGPFWMVVSCFSFSTMSVFVKLGSDTLSTAELMFYRASIALLVVLVTIVIPGRCSLKVSRPVLRLYAGRSFCGAISMMMATYSMAHLPLPTAITLQNTTPLFLMVLIAVLHRGLPSLAQVFSIALGFMGVTLLLQPSISSDLLFPCSMGLLSGLFSAGSMFNIRELGRAGEPEWRVVFYFLLTSTVFSGVWMLIQPYAMASLDWGNAGIIVLMGLFAGMGQLSVTRAYGRGKSMVVASLSYLTVAFTSIYGILIWQDDLPWLSYAAMLLIAGAGIVSALRPSQA